MDEKTVIVGKMSKKTAIIPLIIGGCLFILGFLLYSVNFGGAKISSYSGNKKPFGDLLFFTSSTNSVITVILYLGLLLMVIGVIFYIDLSLLLINEYMVLRHGESELIYLLTQFRLFQPQCLIALQLQHLQDQLSFPVLKTMKMYIKKSANYLSIAKMLGRVQLSLRKKQLLTKILRLN